MKATERLSVESLDQIVLQVGGHRRRSLDALCVMEAIAWVAGQPHTDHPPCVSGVIGDFLRAWNDAMNDEDRQILKRLVSITIGTAGTAEQELQRSWMAVDWYCRVSAPAWLRLAGLTDEAEAIEAAAPIVGSVSAAAAQDALNTARSAAARAAARAAAGAAARVAAWDAAWDAARAAAGAAARVAAGDAAGDAAGAAARVAAWAAARVAAGDAAGAAARVAAGAAAGDAAGAAAGDAAWAAARATLRPTVEMLQVSAIALVECMCSVTKSEGGS
jgi:hypothetical protein